MKNKEKAPAAAAILAIFLDRREGKAHRNQPIAMGLS